VGEDLVVPLPIESFIFTTIDHIDNAHFERRMEIIIMTKNGWNGLEEDESDLGGLKGGKVGDL
jgi:hypothetical protein